MSRKVKKDFITIPLDEIVPYENNPRINDAAVADVIQSIKQCENLDPIEIDENNVILSGHTRLMALRQLEYTETEVIRFTGLSETRKRKYRIYANKAAEKSTWDAKKLKLEINRLGLDGVDLGFQLDLPKVLPEQGCDAAGMRCSRDAAGQDDDGGYYGDEREKTYNAVNLNEYDENRTAGYYQFPFINACDFIPECLIGFNYVKTAKDFNCGVHFFIDDYQFERVWSRPYVMIKRLLPFECCLTPDFSLYMDMPMAMKIWNVYRSRLIGQMMQDAGINVIPTLQWAERETLEWCFNGLGKGGTVAVSTVGVMRDAKAQVVWAEGMDAAIEQLEPQTVLCYGSRIDYDFGRTKVKYFDARRFGGKKVGG